MDSMQSTGGSWFLRIDGRIRGPYSTSVLTSMKQRGKISASTEISADRREWINAGSLHVLFGDADSAPETTTHEIDTPASPGQIVPSPPMPSASAGLSALPNGNANCFYSLDGVVHGPVPLASLQARAENGQLAASDYVWIEGQLTWIEASKALAFSTPERKASSWLRSNMVIVACAAGMSLLLIVIPAWYVISLAGEQEREQHEARLATERAREKEQEELDKRIARLDKRRTELLASEQHIEEQRNILQQTLAQLDVEDRRHEETLRKMEQERLQQEEIHRERMELDRQLVDLEEQKVRALEQGNEDAERNHEELMNELRGN